LPHRSPTISVGSSPLGRNTFLNLVGQVAPLGIGALALPLVVRGLGVDQFGLLSVSWTILGYFAIFDFGFGPAMTRYIAQALGEGDLSLATRIVGSGLLAQALLGILGGLLLFLLTPLLAERILSVPPELVSEATATFRVLAISMPLVLLSSSLMAVLQAAQRFDLMNAVRVPSAASTYLAPLIGTLVGFHVAGIVILIVALRLVAVVVLFVLARRVYPSLYDVSVKLATFRRLLQYGGWMTVSSAVGSILTYLDRFMIGTLLSTTALGYYTVPSEVVTRLSIVPLSLAMTLFPTFSVLDGASDRERLGTLFARSVNYLLLALTPVVLFLALFGEDALRLWMGPDFAQQGGTVLRILSIGALASFLAYIPIDFLKGIGRPDLSAKLQVVELPISIAITWGLTTAWGLPGAAAAWSLRVLMNACLLFGAAMIAGRVSPSVFVANRLLVTGTALTALIATAAIMRELGGALPFLIQSGVFVIVLGVFSLVVWRRVLDALDRGAVLRAVRLWR
jgi:O-antigen/teichoic acid export membrane protein